MKIIILNTKSKKACKVYMLYASYSGIFIYDFISPFFLFMLDLLHCNGCTILQVTFQKNISKLLIRSSTYGYRWLLQSSFDWNIGGSPTTFWRKLYLIHNSLRINLDVTEKATMWRETSVAMVKRRTSMSEVTTSEVQLR